MNAVRDSRFNGGGCCGRLSHSLNKANTHVNVVLLVVDWRWRHVFAVTTAQVACQARAQCALSVDAQTYFPGLFSSNTSGFCDGGK